MKTYIKNGRKYVQARDGMEYSYYTVLVVAIATLIVSFLLMVVGIILILGEPDVILFGTFLKIMILKTVIGTALCYVAYLILKVFNNIMERF